MLRRARVVFFALLAPAYGQIDPAARPFFEGAAPLEPAARTAPMRALDYTLCSTFYERGAPAGEACVRTAMDFRGRHMLSETRHGDGAGGFKLVYAGGRGYFVSQPDGRREAVPKDQLRVLD